MKKLKFIHCADLHLDSPFVGLSSLPEKIYEKTKQSTFHSFTKIVDIALNEQVDFMIIAGDIYDGEDRSIRAQILFKNEMERLHKQNIPVFIVLGNHDHLGGNWTKIRLPENVFTFSPTVEMIPYTTSNGAIVHLYGFSYPKKHVYERMIDHYQKISGADYHIGILHGHDSANESHYSYAPFKRTDLLDKDFDYWALGHIHKKEILSKEPYIIYPGNIQGRHRNEQGEKGCFLVEMDEFHTDITFIPTASIQFETKELEEGANFHSFDDLYQGVAKLKDHLRKNDLNIFLEIKINGANIDDSVKKWLTSDEFLSLVREGEEQFHPFIWLDRITVQEKESSIFEQVDDDFYSEMKSEFLQLEDLDEPLSSFFNQSRVKKLVDPLTGQEEANLKKEAEKLLYQLLKS